MDADKLRQYLCSLECSPGVQTQILAFFLAPYIDWLVATITFSHEPLVFIKSDDAHLLYLQGKPGSGKSTLTRYFKKNLVEREHAAESALICSFFYSFREGDRQTSHYSMLRSILYDILI